MRRDPKLHPGMIFRKKKCRAPVRHFVVKRTERIPAPGRQTVDVAACELFVGGSKVDEVYVTAAELLSPRFVRCDNLDGPPCPV